jgi:hypothetical protein
MAGLRRYFFVELPPEIQKQHGYDSKAVRNFQQQQAASFGIEELPPITLELRDEMLSALRLTDNVDAPV